jgi:predicted HD phosphohydrolase
LQTAHLAEQSGASDALITACLLHDIGHMLGTVRDDVEDTPTLRGVDDRHQYTALPWLRGMFDDQVLEPVRLHVDAKRYLCHARPEYHERLSDDSKRSLALQGGVFGAEDAAAFIARPGARDAVMLRQWDDLAKQQDLPTPTLAHFLEGAVRRAMVPAPAPA